MAVNKLDNSMIDPNDIGTSANQLVQLDGSAKIPAVDGSLLTGVASVFTKSASDPTISTNPSGGVGSLWINTTSGEAYCCTDATAGENVWTNIGAGSGDIIPYSFQGSNYGYNYSGNSGGNGIDKVSYTSDGNATDVADVSLERNAWTSTSSATKGFCIGGYVGGVTRTLIDSFTFATEATMVAHGDILVKRRGIGGHSSPDYSYVTGGYLVAGEGGSGGAAYNEMQRFATASDADGVDIGDLALNITSMSPASDGGTNGFLAGGWRDGSKKNEIQKFSMSSSTTSSDWADLVEAQGAGAGCSSTTHGYMVGGGESGISDQMCKYPFASQTNGTDVGNLIRANFQCCGTSSTTYAYVHGGMNPHGGTPINDLQKIAYASDANATDVGDLPQSRGYLGTCGSQY